MPCAEQWWMNLVSILLEWYGDVFISCFPVGRGGGEAYSSEALDFERYF